MAIKKNGGTFPNALIVSEGAFVTPQGDQVQSVYVDLAGDLRRNTLCLVKASEPQFNLAVTSSIRLSRPAVFRETGEVLIRDTQEGRARTAKSEIIEAPSGEAEQLRKREKAISVGLKLGPQEMSIKSPTKSVKTKSTGSAVNFGRDWLIYCTSICPPAGEEDNWKRALPDNYTSMSHIYRPTQFAQGLGLGICEQIGLRGKPSLVRSKFTGFRTVEVHRKTQMVLHGPVLYVDDAYRYISEAAEGWESMCAMIFVKSREYTPQREYRFALLSIKPDIGAVFYLPISGILRDCLSPVRFPDTRSSTSQMAVSIDNAPDHAETVSPSGYRYSRRVRRRRHERSTWGEDDNGSERSSEEVIEETVTSPDEIPTPFPAQEESRPDVILFEQCGGRIRCRYHAFREEETRRWRIERVNENIVAGPAGRVRPKRLSLSPGVRYHSSEGRPANPRLALQLCFDPSAPRQPVPYPRLERCSRHEIGHVLACGHSLGMAVDCLDSVDQERGAASAWYAFRFILDLVTLLGPIVGRVCIIRECVALVELKRAPLSAAVAWATFSGAGAYTLYINDGSGEEMIFPGRLSRASTISPSTYIDALRRSGWNRKV